MIVHLAAQPVVGALLQFELLQGGHQLAFAPVGVGHVLPQAQQGRGLALRVAQRKAHHGVVPPLAFALDAVLGQGGTSGGHGLLVRRSQGHGLLRLEEVCVCLAHDLVVLAAQ
jgi:hypothetical protein